MCYNCGVKSKSLSEISYVAAVAVAGIAGVCATAGFFAPRNAYASAYRETRYPEIFTEYVNDNLDGFTDFATDGKSYAFADRNGIIVVKDETRTPYDVKNVSAIDCYDGKYYYKVGSNSYSLSTLETADYAFSSDYSRAILSDGSDYIIHTDGKAYFRAFGELTYEPIENSSACKKLKVYANIAYAFLEGEANDNGNTVTVKKLSGVSCTDVNPSYIEFKGTKHVSLGDVKTSLKTFNTQKPEFVTLNAGSYYTEIDINNLAGEEFDAKETYKCGDMGALYPSEVMLSLAETGNAKVFTDGEKCYIALSKNLKTDDYATEGGITEAEFTRAYVTAPDRIFSSPYLSDSTALCEIGAGDEVRVLGKVSAQNVRLQFYKVETGEGANKVTGYMLGGLLQPASDGEGEHPDDKNFGIVSDPDYSQDDLIKIVVLLLVVIALVLIGLAYVTYVLTSKKRGKYKKVDPIETDEDKK